jgi:hypothetical protein
VEQVQLENLLLTEPEQVVLAEDLELQSLAVMAEMVA